MRRKEWKGNARGVLKRHYGLFVILCLVAGILGTECTSSLTFIQEQFGTNQEAGTYTNTASMTDLSQLSSQIITDSIAQVLEVGQGEKDQGQTQPETGAEGEEAQLPAADGEAQGEETQFAADGAAQGEETQPPASDEAAQGDSSEAAEQDGREAELTPEELALQEAGAEALRAAEEAENDMFGRTRGVFASLVNGLLSGSFLSTLVVGIRTVTGSQQAAQVVFILLALAVLFLFQYFALNVCQSVIRRMFLEGRCYDQVPPGRALFLLKVRRWRKAAVTLLLQSIFYGLWSITIVGGIIKRYSYAMVPYIVAENPDLGARQAITLSRKLMKGHKWELFMVDLSFIGWEFLGGITLGLVNLLYTNPYRIATKTEFYVHVRDAGKAAGIPDADLLNDQYLYERASQALLDETYADVVRMEARPDTVLGGLHGIRKWIADIFGVVIWNSRDEKRYEQEEAEEICLADEKEEWQGERYPTRLYPIPTNERREWVATVHYIRHYTVWSLILLFFVMSVVGWIWEVTLHLITDGTFVNRGVLHGPWLPIYGTGSILILVLLNKFRKKPLLEFISAIVVSGCVEYYISWHLEQVYNGTKWWDYTGYFLNINGRVCAEGLLTFGLGGLLIVYLLAPLLDNLFRKIPKKILVVLCLALLAVYCGDQLYSGKYPNTGDGITNIESGGGSAELTAVPYEETESVIARAVRAAGVEL